MLKIYGNDAKKQRNAFDVYYRMITKSGKTDVVAFKKSTIV